METFFKGLTVEHIKRTKNIEADELAKAVARKAELPPDVFTTRFLPFCFIVESLE
jgi:hypothetical protein